MGRRGLLLDRDGVINVDHGYVGKIEQFSFMDGLLPFLRRAQDMGFRMAILTNQAGVARGYYTARDYETLTAHMLDGLRREGIAIELVLGCFEHPEGSVDTYRRESFWRKPNPGMVLEAMQRLNLDPTRSAFLGDTIRDLEAAHGGAVKSCLWLTEKTDATHGYITKVHSYDEALAELTKLL